MSITTASRALSPLDAAFLHLESPRTPMHYGSVGIFDGGPLTGPGGVLRLGELRAVIESRLAAVPKLRQRVRPGLFAEAPPVWVDDDSFAIENHVRQAAACAPGGEEELLAVVDDLMATPLDRERPLWELWFVGGLHGGRVALVEKIHHALADGLSGVEVASVLLDLQGRPPQLPPAPPSWSPAPPEGPVGVLRRDLNRLAALPAQAAAAAVHAARHPTRWATRAGALASGITTFAPTRLLAPRSTLNTRIGAGRRIVFVRQPLQELQAVQQAFGVTVNDILLTAVTGGIREVLLERGEQLDDREVQVLVPVGVSHEEQGTLGNKVSALVVRLPIGVEGSAKRLRQVAAEVADHKRRHQAAVPALLLDLARPLPQVAIAGIAQLVQHQPLVNLVVTNVPGPPVPLYAMGARMLEAFPIVPLAGNLSVGVAALSYAGTLGLGLSAARDQFPELPLFAEGITEELAALVAATERRGGGQRRTRKEERR